MTGFQGIVERVPRGVTIYLLPGLTGRQRRAVIRRLRQEASRGCGPELPLAQLLVALLLDRVRGALRLAAGAVRLHPGTTLLPAAFVAAVMTLFVLASAGVEAVPAVRPALAAAQSDSAAPVDGPRRRRHRGALVSIGAVGRRHPAEQHRTGRPGSRLGPAGARDRAALERAAAGRAGVLRRDAGGRREGQSARLPPYVQLVRFSLGSVAT